MSAFNWIEFEKICPYCEGEQCIRAQVHMVSDYNGDDQGRFHDVTYNLGDKMRWWKKLHPDYEKWKNGNKKDTSNIEEDKKECCYAQCLNCNRELYAVIRFSECVPLEVIEFGSEENWPDSYLK